MGYIGPFQRNPDDGIKCIAGMPNRFSLTSNKQTETFTVVLHCFINIRTPYIEIETRKFITTSSEGNKF